MVSELYPKHTHTHLPSYHQRHTYTLTSKLQLLLINALALYMHVHILHMVPETILLNPHNLSEYMLDPTYTQLLHIPLYTHILMVGSWGRKTETNFFKQNQETVVRSMLLKDIFHLCSSPVEWQSTKQSFNGLNLSIFWPLCTMRQVWCLLSISALRNHCLGRNLTCICLFILLWTLPSTMYYAVFNSKLLSI